MSDITATFETDSKLVMASYRACHRRGYIGRWVIAVALVMFGLITTWHFVALLGPIYWITMELSVRRQLRPYLDGPRTVTVTMTDDEYRTEGADRATSRTWTTFERVDRVGDFWVLRISNASAMGLPVTALTTDQTSAFMALLRDKGLRAG